MCAVIQSNLCSSSLMQNTLGDPGSFSVTRMASKAPKGSRESCCCKATATKAPLLQFSGRETFQIRKGSQFSVMISSMREDKIEYRQGCCQQKIRNGYARLSGEDART